MKTTQVFIPESTVSVWVLINWCPCHVALHSRQDQFVFGFVGNGHVACPSKKRSKERCSVEVLPEGSKLKLCSKQVSLVQVHFSDVMNDNWCLCESRNLVRRFKLIPIAGIEKKLDVAEHRTTQWTIKLNTNIHFLLSCLLLAMIPKKNNTDMKIEWLRCDLMGSSCRLSGVVSPCASCLRVSHGSPNFLVTTATGVFSKAFSTMEAMETSLEGVYVDVDFPAALKLIQFESNTLRLGEKHRARPFSASLCAIPPTRRALGVVWGCRPERGYESLLMDRSRKTWSFFKTRVTQCPGNSSTPCRP